MALLESLKVPESNTRGGGLERNTNFRFSPWVKGRKRHQIQSISELTELLLPLNRYSSLKGEKNYFEAGIGRYWPKSMLSTDWIVFNMRRAR
jgi:hypothetical protein